MSLIAYNLGNLWRRLVLPARLGAWSLTSLQQRLVKTGGRLIKHSRYYWRLLAESYMTRRLFGSMLQRNRDAAVASGVAGPQSGADFGDEIGWKGDKCLRTRLEKRQFRVFYANARQNWSVAGPWKAP